MFAVVSEGSVGPVGSGRSITFVVCFGSYRSVSLLHAVDPMGSIDCLGAIATMDPMHLLNLIDAMSAMGPLVFFYRMDAINPMGPLKLLDPTDPLGPMKSVRFCLGTIISMDPINPMDAVASVNPRDPLTLCGSDRAVGSERPDGSDCEWSSESDVSVIFVGYDRSEGWTCWIRLSRCIRWV